MKCSVCGAGSTMGIIVNEKTYCLDCGKGLLPERHAEEPAHSIDIEECMNQVPKELQPLLRSFDMEILAELTEEEWQSPEIIEYCMDKVLEKVFPTLSLEDATYTYEGTKIEVTLSRYWQERARFNEEVLEYVSCLIQWKRR